MIGKKELDKVRGRRRREEWIGRDGKGNETEGKKRGGKSNPVGADRFLGEQCYLCFPLHRHSQMHTNSVVIERANKSLWKSTCIRRCFLRLPFFFFYNQERLKRRRSRLTKK